MHELALMTSLVDRVCEIAIAENAKCVTDIHVKRGEFSGVIPESLNFCSELCVADTIAEKSKLHIHDVPAEWHCSTCNKTITKIDDMNIPVCPECKTCNLRLISGREFKLESIEIE